jgi:DNA repair exonuclease SbcCD nuclease subunit
MKFAHIADCHLGGWRQPELQQLNFESFKKAIEISIEENVDFILFAGDLFDSPFPGIDILKNTFAEFRKIKEKGIKSYIISGSHDYSVSGKTFLEVLEHAGFCEICKYEYDKKTDRIILKPIIFPSCYIYGYPGKKSGLEIEDLKKISILEPDSNFRILMLHTTIKEAVNNLLIESIDLRDLPSADYYALGHIHVDFQKEFNKKPVIYAGPTFPNNFKEFEELKYGKFFIVDVGGFIKISEKKIIFKKIECVELEITNTFKATEKILLELEKRDLKDKIVLLKVYGILKEGKPSDINYSKVQDYVSKSNAYSFLKNTAGLDVEKSYFNLNINPKENENIEEIFLKKYQEDNPSEYNKLIFPLMETLGLEKQEDERSSNFEQRLLLELKKMLDIDIS